MSLKVDMPQDGIEMDHGPWSAANNGTVGIGTSRRINHRAIWADGLLTLAVKIGRKDSEFERVVGDLRIGVFQVRGAVQVCGELSGQ